MTTAAPKRRIWLPGFLVVLLLVAAGGAYAWRRTHRLVVPTVPVVGLDPEVIAALADARARVEQQPNSAEAWGHYGLVTFAHNKYVECRPMFERAEQLDPTDYRWPYYRGLAWKFERPEEMRYGAKACLGVEPAQPGHQTSVGGNPVGNRPPGRGRRAVPRSAG